MTPIEAPGGFTSVFRLKQSNHGRRTRLLIKHVCLQLTFKFRSLGPVALR